MTIKLRFASTVLLMCGVAYGQNYPHMSCSSQRLKESMSTSKSIVLAKVKKVFSPPGYWSGMFAAMQLVEYEPTRVLKGELKQTSMVVSHYVVSNSATADTHEDRPQLSPALFLPGREVIVLLNQGPGKFWEESSRCATRENELCSMVSKDERRVGLAQAAKANPDPTYTVENENCGVLPADEWQATVANLLKQ